MSLFLGAKAPLGLVSVGKLLRKKLEISKSRMIWTQNDIHWFLKVLYGPVPCSEWQLPESLGAKAPLGLVRVSKWVTKKLEISKSLKIST